MQQVFSSFKETVEEVRHKPLKQDKINVKSLNTAAGHKPTSSQANQKQKVKSNQVSSTTRASLVGMQSHGAYNYGKKGSVQGKDSSLKVNQNRFSLQHALSPRQNHVDLDHQVSSQKKLSELTCHTQSQSNQQQSQTSGQRAVNKKMSVKDKVQLASSNSGLLSNSIFRNQGGGSQSTHSLSQYPKGSTLVQKQNATSSYALKDILQSSKVSGITMPQSNKVLTSV